MQSNKGYEGFFDIIFGFLSRKTDFYQNPKMAQDICKTSAEKNLKEFLDKKNQK